AATAGSTAPSSTSSSSERIGTPVNFRMLASMCPARATAPRTMLTPAPAAADVTVDDVHARSVVEASVLQPLRRIELAVGAGRVVEQARERAEHVIVVMEDLVVKPARTRVPLHEDRVRSVDLDLPDVVIDEERRQRPVAAEVAQC